MTLSRLSTSSVYNVQVNNGLLGAGGWASVIATTGSPTTATYTDGNGVEWRYWQWTGSGSVTTTAGFVDTFLIGGGTRGYAVNFDGGAGGTLYGLQAMPAGTHTVTVGAGGSGSSPGDRIGGQSILGQYNTITSTLSVGAGIAPTYGAFTSSITGSALTFGLAGQASPRANCGDGGAASTNTNGSSGTVIIRVPTNPGLTVPQQPQGLSGVGNWAFVTATTGSPTKGSYTDVNGSWTYYQWTSSGSVTVTAGVVDRLIVAGGSGGNGASHGGSGLAVPGLQYLSAGSKSVVVGAGSAGGQTPAASVVNAGPSALDGLNFRSGIEAGFSVTSSITGTSQVYAQSNASPARAGFGDGGSYVGNVSGSSGTVIIRVPSQFALA